MGAYNTLIANLKCANCHRAFVGNLQFKVGDVRQYTYKIGDEVRTNSEDKGIIEKDIIGYGILEDDRCPYCGHRNFEEYDIYIRQGRIVKIDKMADLSLFLNSNEGRYFVKGNQRGE